MSGKKHQDTDANIVRCYEVTEPTLHSKGYTIYKVTEQLISIDALEQNVKEAVVWRRFNDFRKLHRCLSTLHAALHRREEFPDFPKPQLFHRFEKSVVVDRMRSAQDLLNFAGQRHYLVACKAFKEFFSGAQPVKTSPNEGHLLEPIKPQSVNNKLGAAVETNATSSVRDGNCRLELSAGGDRLQPNQSLPVPQTDAGGRATVASSPDSTVEDPSRIDMGEGFWCYRQVQEETSSGGHEDDDDDEDDDNESDDVNSLPDIQDGAPTFTSNRLIDSSDLVLFDPLAMKLEATGHPEPSNEYLLSMVASNVVDGDDLLLETSQEMLISLDNNTGLDTCPVVKDETLDLSLSSRYASDLADILGSTTEPERDDSSQTMSRSTPSGLAPHPVRSGSIVESGKGDLTVSPLHQLTERKNSSSLWEDPRRPTQSSLTPSPKKSSWTVNIPYFASLEKSSYVVEAAEQISRAKKLEAAGVYHEAFSQYKCAVGTLLKGVQKDGDERQREAVRRKIAVYLRKAEELYHEHLINDNDQGYSNRWDLEHGANFTELDSSIALLRGVSSELGRYKVVGLISKVLLVVDSHTDGSLIIKVLHKSSVQMQNQPTIVPTHIPYMVSLVKFFETDSAIYLILQHAAGGTLWNYISGYFGQFVQDVGQDFGTDIYGDLHEKQLRSAGRKVRQIKPKTGTATNEISDIGSQETKSKLDTSELFIGNKDLKNWRTVNETDTLSDDCFLNSDLPTEQSLGQTYFGNVPNHDDHNDSEKMSGLTSKLKSSILDLHNESNDDIEELDTVGSNQDFKSVLDFCKSDINSYSICSIDSENATLSRLASMSSDHTEPVAITEMDVQTFLPVSEDRLEVEVSVFDNGGLSSGKSETVYSSAVANSTVPLPVCHKSSESPTSNTTCSISKSKCGLNLPLKMSVSSVSDARSVTPTMQQNRSSNSDFREPLKSPSMSQLSSAEKSTCTASGGHRRRRELSSVFAELDLASEVPSETRHVTQLPEGCIRQWAAEMVVAVSRLHCLGIICRDLHPSNILLGERGHILLTYFSQWNTVDQHISEEALEGLYCAPEISSVTEITAACDWWSLGAILYELFTGQSFRSCHPAGITSHSSITTPSHVSEEASSLITELLKFNPAERLGSGIGGSEDVKTHPFFTGIQWNHLLG